MNITQLTFPRMSRITLHKKFTLRQSLFILLMCHMPNVIDSVHFRHAFPRRCGTLHAEELLEARRIMKTRGCVNSALSHSSSEVDAAMTDNAIFTSLPVHQTKKVLHSHALDQRHKLRTAHLHLTNMLSEQAVHLSEIPYRQLYIISIFNMHTPRQTSHSCDQKAHFPCVESLYAVFVLMWPATNAYSSGSERCLLPYQLFEIHK